MKKPLTAAIIGLLLCLSLLPLAAATNETIELSCYNNEPYINEILGLQTRRVSFWAIVGEHVAWWQGGIKFVYYPDSPVGAEKIEALKEGLLQLFRRIGFVTVTGEVKPTFAFIVYRFDGVLQYDDYMFADGDGIVVIKWIEDKPLEITVYAAATINMTASSELQVVGGNWRWEQVTPSVKRLVPPKAEIKAPGGEFDILFVPREGVLETHLAKLWRLHPEPTIEEYQFGDIHLTITSGGPFAIYVGGRPAKTRVTEIRPVISGGAMAGFWDKMPDYKIVYSEDAVTTYKLDHFYGYEYVIAKAAAAT